MLEESALRDMYPVVMTPSHDGKFFHNYTLSCLNLLSQFMQEGLRVQFYMLSGESLITRARNDCVAQFLATPEWTHLFWVDGDIGFSVDSFRRLLLADRDIVTGAYPLKHEFWPEEGVPEGTTREQFLARYSRYVVNKTSHDDSDEVHINVDQDGFIELEDAPTGFMCIKRSVLERMVEAFPEYKYTPDSHIPSQNKHVHYRFFDCFVDPVSNRYLSEDYGFCRLWNQLGGKVYVDAYSNLTHQGSKLYQGPFAETLQVNLPGAIGATTGKKMFLHLTEPLKINTRFP